MPNYFKIRLKEVSHPSADFFAWGFSNKPRLELLLEAEPRLPHPFFKRGGSAFFLFPNMRKYCVFPKELNDGFD